MTRRTTLLLLSSLALALAACGSRSETGSSLKKDEGGKRYPMQGVIRALDANAKSASIDAGKIGDWMEPMTMDYPVKPDAEFQKLHVGDRIEATVVVKEPSYYVTDVKVVAKQ